MKIEIGDRDRQAGGALLRIDIAYDIANNATGWGWGTEIVGVSVPISISCLYVIFSCLPPALPEEGCADTAQVRLVHSHLSPRVGTKAS